MKKLHKRILSFIILFLLISTIFPGIIADHSILNKVNDNSKPDVSEFEHKNLIYNGTIGRKNVQYWEHKINNVTIKGDSILVHLDSNKKELLEFQTEWTPIPEHLIEEFNFELTLDNYLWKQKVIFPNEEDISFSYSFHKPIKYPLTCWEVRYKNGSTILYNTEGTKIGTDIACPSKTGFSLSGDVNDGGGDGWKDWRLSANKWFRKWCDNTETIKFPTATYVSDYIQDPNTDFFYELAHGNSKSFQCGRENEEYEEKYYTQSHCRSDMTNRTPFLFAFIGSCGGMDYVGENTFSYEFRKGRMMGTVTIGYTHIPSYPGSFGDTLPWQEKMFYYMNKGWTIKDSFDEACSYNPKLTDHVVFIGDENLKVKDNPPLIPSKIIGPNIVDLNTSYSFSTSTFEPDGDDVYYQFDWGDGTISDWIGPFDYDSSITANHSWIQRGDYYYEIKSRAKDEFDLESDWSEPLIIQISSEPPSPPVIQGPINGTSGSTYEYYFSSIDPENDAINYYIYWGHDTGVELGPYESGEEIKVLHKFPEKKTYTIRARAIDSQNMESEWSELEVTMPKRNIFYDFFMSYILHKIPLLKHLFEFS